jgi:hypothetical protein
MNLDALDTSTAARTLQGEAHHRLGPEGRLQVAFDLSEAVRDLRLAGLRAALPEAGEEEWMRRFILEAHGIRLGASE